MNTPTDPLEWLLRTSSINSEIDRKTLAGLLFELARNVEPGLCQDAGGVKPVDPRLELLRTLVLGREINELSRLGELVEDPEQFAQAVGRVLPTAVAQATADARLGKVLVPTLEKAAQASIKTDPSALVNILHPLMVPAIRKSIGESIDQTFQSLNESLKHSLTWRGLKWRWEAWRTGTTFASVVLKHTLVYQVEHVFLIHRQTGLLIAHASAAGAVSEDPQLVSSMLAAIQDFVRDSFGGVGQRGLDTLRLGELRLWSEVGLFATIVAVIRGNPPEELHDTLRNVLSRIHAERPRALENFDGDSSGFADIEARLAECAALRQQAESRKGFPWLAALVWLVPLLLAGAWGYHWWHDEHLWQNYVAQLRAQPGLVVTELGRSDGKFQVAGLRDPLAVDPMQLLTAARIDPTHVAEHWQPYQSLYPEFVMKRLQASLDPPSTVSLAVEGDRIVARGSAPASWIERAHTAERMLPAGGPSFDLSGVRDSSEDRQLWEDYVKTLRAQPGIVITELRDDDGEFRIAGLRDPLAIDPMQVLAETQIDPAHVTARWQSYESLYPEFVMKRLQASLDPPATVTMAVEGDRVVARGSAPASWIERAHTAERLLPAGGPSFDLSGVRDSSEELRLWESYVKALRAEPGIVITELSEHDGEFRIAGLRDPLAVDPMQMLREAGIDPEHVTARWQSYESLHPEFVMKRLQVSLDPPRTVSLAVDGDRILARGSASSTWIEHARAAARALPAGGPSLDLSAIRDINEEGIGRLRDAIQSRVIRFNNNESLPAPDQDATLDELANELNELAALSASLRVTPRVMLTGHSDSTGRGTFNLSLSLARAEAVRALLKKRSVDPDLLLVRGAGPFEPREAGTSETALSANRRVSFTVAIE